MGRNGPASHLATNQDDLIVMAEGMCERWVYTPLRAPDASRSTQTVYPTQV